MVKINLGCGWRDFGKDWIHIDGGDYPHLNSKDIINLPFEDNSVDLIYVSHVLEYFDRTEVINIINKWKSKLKPKGILRLAVPDFKNITKLYQENKIPLDSFLGPLYGKMEMDGNTIYHKTTYDFDSLKLVLNKCGFTNIDYYDWGQTEHSNFDDHSQAYIPHMDKTNGTLISLNVEATK
jgi:ubiquinone/menaquinone biosynthesis C-methylase UbiE